MSRSRRPNGATAALLVALLISLAACSAGSEAAEESGTATTQIGQATTTQPSTPTTTPEPTITGLPLTIPDWLYTRTLATDDNGYAAPQDTPAELIDRKLPPVDVLPLPTSYDFSGTISPFDGEPLARSTWHDGCPVTAAQLRYVTVTYWGFDERPHQGELILHQDVALDVARAFKQIYEARFPIEEMRIVRPDELTALPTGDGNNSASFVCRAVTLGDKFSQHAYGLAIDVNPFHNPYIRGELVLPELATFYLDRSQDFDGMLHPDSAPVEAFLELGWGWGGNWNSLKDYQHFSQNGK